MLRPAIAVAGLLFIFGAVGGTVFWLSNTGPNDPISRAAAPFDYDLVGWEWRHLANRWLYNVGHLFDDGPSEEEQNDMVRRYFALAGEVASLERDEIAGRPVEPTLDEKRSEQQQLENKVENILERRLTTVLEDQGLTTSLPLFSSVRFVFPPVDFEFARPPTVLAISPRDEIHLDKEILLQGGLSDHDVEVLETRTAATGVSSLVVDIEAIAFYPSAIPPDSSYESALDSVAHEWLHQYLFFHPLGRSYFDSNETRTLNETAANIGGHELGGLVKERFPLSETASPTSTPSPSPPSPKIDFRKEMHDLRLQVDALLGEGKIEGAEALMEEVRKFLAANGYYVRKINQAFFAFNGLYADTAASSNPIGPKMAELRQLSPSVGEFLRAVSGITSEKELDALLARSQGQTVTPP